MHFVEIIGGHGVFVPAWKICATIPMVKLAQRSRLKLALEDVLEARRSMRRKLPSVAALRQEAGPRRGV